MKNISFLIIVFITILLCYGVVFAAFDDMGIGARPLGMGGAFVAIADDTNASMYNPAGLGYITGAAAGFTHVMMFSNVVRYEYASALVPLSKAGTIGVSFGMLGEESGIYSERSVALSYSNKLAEIVSLGVNLKMLNTGFDSDNFWVTENPYFANTSASAFTFDLGLLAKPLAGLSLGLSGENLIPANIGLAESGSDELLEDVGEEKVPMNFRFGLAYSLSKISASVEQPALKEVLGTTILSVEGSMRKEREVNALKVRAGLEAWFANQTVALRAGYRMKKVNETSSATTVGASLRLPITDVNIQLDYALQIFGADIQDKLAHRVSLSISL